MGKWSPKSTANGDMVTFSLTMILMIFDAETQQVQIPVMVNSSTALRSHSMATEHRCAKPHAIHGYMGKTSMSVFTSYRSYPENLPQLPVPAIHSLDPPRMSAGIRSVAVPTDVAKPQKHGEREDG